MEAVARYKPYFEWLWNHLLYIILGASVIIQISPIKLDPWKKIFKWIGDAINGELKESITTINTTIDNIKGDILTNEKDRIRWEVLDFANSCRNGRNHSLDEFKHIITLNDKYTRLLQMTNDNNGVFDIEYQYILKLYEQKQANNDFLK